MHNSSPIAISLNVSNRISLRTLILMIFGSHEWLKNDADGYTLNPRNSLSSSLAVVLDHIPNALDKFLPINDLTMSVVINC